MFVIFAPAVLEAASQSAGLNSAQQVVVDGFVEQISTVEWLAPLAPIALSPFFGICLLSGLACYGPEWLPNHGLLSDASPFANPTLFWIFLVLTFVTSLPRFSKVSKPIAQVSDFLETWSAVIVLAAMKFSASPILESEPAVAMVTSMGIVELGWDALVTVAMAVNIVVVNAVKFFFEFLVWITPVPMLDAAFEVANKALCAALMGIYAFSPIAALVLNVILFLVCFSIYGWAYRRAVFYRTTLVDLVLGWFSKGRGEKAPEQLTVFPAFDVGPIKRRSKCRLSKTDEGLRLVQHRWLRNPISVEITGLPVIEKDWWTNSVNLPAGIKLTFTTRYNRRLPELAEHFGGAIHEAASKVSDPKYAKQIEFG